MKEEHEERRRVLEVCMCLTVHSKDLQKVDKISSGSTVNLCQTNSILINSNNSNNPNNCVGRGRAEAGLDTTKPVWTLDRLLDSEIDL